MNDISKFQQIRRDGRIVDESMTGVEMIRAGWPPDKILALQWVWNGRPVELKSRFGFLSRVVAGRDYAAVLEDTDETGRHALLTIYRADGSARETFPNELEIAGKRYAGEFVSFRSPQSPLPTAFSVLFSAFSSGGTYQTDIDASSGAVLGLQEVRW
jgi:hypothetical protein